MDRDTKLRRGVIPLRVTAFTSAPCLTRRSTIFGPYGFGYSVQKGGLGTGDYSDKNGTEAMWTDTPPMDYREVDWADVQRRCFQDNSARFQPLPAKTSIPLGFYVQESKSSIKKERADTEVMKSNTTALHSASEASKAGKGRGRLLQAQ